MFRWQTSPGGNVNTVCWLKRVTIRNHWTLPGTEIKGRKGKEPVASSIPLYSQENNQMHSHQQEDAQLSRPPVNHYLFVLSEWSRPQRIIFQSAGGVGQLEKCFRRKRFSQVKILPSRQNADVTFSVIVCNQFRWECKQTQGSSEIFRCSTWLHVRWEDVTNRHSLSQKPPASHHTGGCK